METYESMSKMNTQNLVAAELSRCIRLYNSPTSEKVKEYAVTRMSECRNMLAWLNTLS